MPSQKDSETLSDDNLTNRHFDLPEPEVDLNALIAMVEDFPQPLFRLNPIGEIIYTNSVGKAITQVIVKKQVVEVSTFWKHFIASIPQPFQTSQVEIETNDQIFVFTCKYQHSLQEIHAYGQEVSDQRSRMNRLISSFSAFNAAILLEDQDRRIVTANKAFVDMFGIPVHPDFLVGQDCSNSAEESKHLFNNPEQFVLRINQILTKKELVLNETIHFADGRIAERDYIPLFIDGEYNGHLWKYSDITAQRKAEQVLSNREKKYRGIIDNFKLGLLEVDKEGIIISCNGAFESMSGYQKSELQGIDPVQLLLPENERSAMMTKHKTRESGVEDVYELPVLNKSGERKRWLISGAPLITDNGEIIGSIGIHWDITEIKALEQELIKARQKAEESSRTKAKFLANMSHEIRTPLNGIMGMIEQMTFTNLDDQQIKYLDVIKTASETLLTIINDILDVSRIESGKFAIEHIPFSIVDTVTKTIDLLETKTKERNNKLTYSIDAKLVQNYLGDPHRINQILFNLVGNAIKFTENGSVDIHCDLIHRRDGKDDVRFAIRDTGIGMDRDFIQRLFTEFEQQDTTIARKYGGSGLGLYITRNLVQLMAGRMRIDSAKGIGTLVEITLTLEQSNSEIARKKEIVTNTEALRGIEILIAEDNYLNRIVIRTVLEKYGVIIEDAENGKDAIAKLKQRHYHLVLMDVEMPEMNGIDATRWIRTHLHPEIKIVGLSANALSEEVNNCLNAGMNDYLVKPYTESELLNIILKWSQRELVHASNEADLTKLREYVGGDEELLRSVIEAYLEFLPESINKLEKALLQNDPDALCNELHQIKPNYENVRIGPVNSTFNELSNLIKLKGLDEANIQTVKQLIIQGHTLLEHFKSYLKKPE
ncbi:MAG: response regulator [Flavobacteriales bacterium]